MMDLSIVDIRARVPRFCSQEDLLIHGDSVYDMIDKQDHQAVQTELSRSQTSAEDQGCKRMFLCRMNVSRNARRQMRFGDQKARKKPDCCIFFSRARAFRLSSKNVRFGNDAR